MPISYEHRCIYIHIPKCAGSAIESVLNIKKRNKLQLHGPDGNGDFLQHYTLSQIESHYESSDTNLRDFYIFTIVRNPYSKLVSDYSWCKRWFKHKWLMKDSTSVGFKSFAEYILFIKAVGVESWSHFRPQYQFIQCGTKCTVFKIESLKKSYPIIKAELRLDSDLPIVNKSSHKHWSKYYSKELYEIVNDMYSNDFSAFGYTKITT
jgi:hypothetical protein